MSSIENRDVKSLAEIQALGGQKADLAHDTKIYITAKGLNKTLAEIIESGEIADGNRFGADVKNFSFAIADGSGEEYNTLVPFVNLDGNTQLDLSFEVKDHEVAQLFVGGEYVTKFVSDAVTKNQWWKIVNDTAIEIKGDITSQVDDVSFIVYRGSEIPVVPSVFSGLTISHEAFGFTDSIGGDNVVGVTEVNGKTRIEFSFEILHNDVVFVYVDNEIYPRKTNANNTGKTHSKISGNTIELDVDLSASHSPFYVAVFQGKSFIDKFGNMVIALKPEIASFLLQSPDGNKWNVAVGLTGAIETESVVTGDNADLILFRRDDETIMELTVEDGGAISCDTQANTGNTGLLFDAIYLSDIDGQVRLFGCTNDNVPYTTVHGKNYFELIRPNGKVIKRFTAMESNAVNESTGYVEEEDLIDVVDEPNQVVTMTPVRRTKDSLFSLFKWDTLTQKWEDWIVKLIDARLAEPSEENEEPKVPWVSSTARDGQWKNLVVGRTYRVFHSHEWCGGTTTHSYITFSGAVSFYVRESEGYVGGYNHTGASSRIFVASATTLNWSWSGNGNACNNINILEELINHEQTTQWN